MLNFDRNRVQHRGFRVRPPHLLQVRQAALQQGKPILGAVGWVRDQAFIKMFAPVLDGKQPLTGMRWRKSRQGDHSADAKHSQQEADQEKDGKNALFHLPPPLWLLMHQAVQVAGGAVCDFFSLDAGLQVIHLDLIFHMLMTAETGIFRVGASMTGRARAFPFGAVCQRKIVADQSRRQPAFTGVVAHLAA